MFDPTESEFDAFPPVVKRKCFSTLERLRLAQGGPPADAHHTYLSRARKTLSPYALHSRLRSPSHYATRRPKRPLKPADFSKEDAQWFQRLPDTVRRKHFSREEQILLAGRCEDVILDAADEVFYKLGARHADRSLPSLGSCSSSPSSAPSLYTDDMDDSTVHSFRWLDEDDELDLRLDDYHTHVAAASAAKLSSSTSGRLSFRKNRSLTHLPFARDIRLSSDRRSALPPAPISPCSPRPSYSHSIVPPHYGASPLSSGLPARHLPQRSITAIDPDAAHYRDPEARMKLRVYLASPQKFDEAIEFGFPSLPHTPLSRPSSRRQSLTKHRRPSVTTITTAVTPAEPQTFFDDDNTSLVRNADDEDTLSLRDPQSPDTPLDLHFRSPHRFSESKRVSGDGARPPLWHAVSEPYTRAWAGHREMTLRMTLTRPDLRADDSVIYPRASDDPLALDELPAASGDAWMKGAKDGGIVKKLWRRVHGKN